MFTPKLLTRDDFREAVFKRDNHTCVLCSAPAKDAHHIIERRLWPDGGYYIDNGASVCEEHHLKCESTEISVEDVREAAGISRVIVPPHLYDDQSYDKWGNPVLPNGTRLKGELFDDESVQKIIQPCLYLFSEYVRYPRTYHLPFSLGINDDDRLHQDMSHFMGKTVVVQEKMDGENTTMYRDYIHARSIDGRHHPSRDWVKNFHARIKHEIPEGWRVCGENMYAQHSIKYTQLESYFYGFSIWTDKNICLSWTDTLEWFELLGITPTTELVYGKLDTIMYNNLVKLYETFNKNHYNTVEGIVMRNVEAFSYRDFRFNVGKAVRKNHVQTTKHWMYGQAVMPNELATETLS